MILDILLEVEVKVVDKKLLPAFLFAVDTLHLPLDSVEENLLHIAIYLTGFSPLVKEIEPAGRVLNANDNDSMTATTSPSKHVIRMLARVIRIGNNVAV